MSNEIAELLAMYDEGLWSKHDLFYQFAQLVPRTTVQAIADQLQDSLRGEFVNWLQEIYDNDLPPDAFISIGHQGDLSEKRLRLDALRAWLRGPNSRDTR